MCLNCLKESPSAERESAKWIFPLYDYRHPAIKKSLWLLKYKGKKRLANVFAEIIYEKILEELSELSIMENFTNAILIPIPLSPQRYRERGYNQAELICRELIKINDMRHLSSLKFRRANGVYEDSVNTKLNFSLENNILIKIKETEHQARIKDRRIRLKNLTGSFAIKNKAKSSKAGSPLGDGAPGKPDASNEAFRENKNIDLIKGRNIILIDDIATTGATLNEARRVLKKSGAKKVIAFTVAH